MAPLLEEAAAEVIPRFDGEGFDSDDPADAGLVQAISKEVKKLQGLEQRVRDVADSVRDQSEKWLATKEGLAWSKAVTKASEDYAALLKRREDEGAGSPDEYASLVARRNEVASLVADLVAKRGELESLQEQSDSALRTLLDHRRELTNRRKTFLSSVLVDNRHVRISVAPYGDREGAETGLRSIIGRDPPAFQNDIASSDGKGLIDRLYKTSTDDEVAFESALDQLRAEVMDRAQGAKPKWPVRDKRFIDHLKTVSPEMLDRLAYWTPEDWLEVSYSRTVDGSNFQPIEQGSPGEKTAAILAFLLSYGEEPIVLDQPEDDLDNRLIYDLIVAQLRENKKRRQIVVVTHNANIVVNGDAEYIVSLDFRKGRTVIAQDGGLQEEDVREEICDVMEGGRAAFELRYQRIGRPHD